MNICSYKPCIAKRKEERELSIACPICLESFHGKCAGLTGRVIDCVNENKGLKWTCPNCKPLDVGLCNMYSHIINGFTILKKDLHCALTKLEQFEKEFSDFESLRRSYSTKHALLQLNSSIFSSCPNSPLFPSSAANGNLENDDTVSNSTFFREEDEDCHMQTIVSDQNTVPPPSVVDTVEATSDSVQTASIVDIEIVTSDASRACVAAQKAAGDSIQASDTVTSICGSIESAIYTANQASEYATIAAANAVTMRSSYAVAREAALAALKSFDLSSVNVSNDSSLSSAAQTADKISSFASKAYNAKNKALIEANNALIAAKKAYANASEEKLKISVAINAAKTAAEYASYAKSYASDANIVAKKAREAASKVDSSAFNDAAADATDKVLLANSAAEAAATAVEKANSCIARVKSMQLLVPNNELAQNITVKNTKNTEYAASKLQTSVDAPKPLTVAANRRTLFLSRLSADITAADVQHYIVTQLPEATNVSVYQYKFQSARVKSSFKISVGDDIFATLLNASFWPQGVLVREFEFRERRNRQPQSLSNNNRSANSNVAASSSSALAPPAAGPSAASSTNTPSKNSKRQRAHVQKI